VNFATATFLLFYVVVTALYWLIPGQTAKKVMLLAASWYFYMSWDPILIVLVLVSTVLDFTVGIVLGRAVKSWQRKAALATSCVGQLGMLAFFKYADFFIDSFQGLAGSLGLHFGLAELHIILPIGISFYTFQSLSYTIDVYRGQCKPCTSFLDFAAFVAFYPQLVAGPISRANQFLPQLAREHRFDGPRFRQGLTRILFGLAKKIVFADTIALAIDPVFAHPGYYGTLSSWIAAVGFSLQLYADFSAYSDIAIGAGWTLGYELPENFNHPYLAQSLREFWQRWHMSLSTWLRDYLYIFALGGNRGAKWKTYRNLMLTMVLGGLWHGASWTFVAWGAYWGAALCTERLLVELVPSFAEGRAGAIFEWGRRLRTFFIACMGFVVFRARTFGEAFDLYRNMLGLGGAHDVSPESFIRMSVLWIMAAVVATHLLAWARERGRFDWTRPPFVRAVLLTGCVLGVLAFARESAEAFIYFQF
jgi:alginate O-acetyltransferase complex protein AlgI